MPLHPAIARSTRLRIIAVLALVISGCVLPIIAWAANPPASGFLVEPVIGPHPCEVQGISLTNPTLRPIALEGWRIIADGDVISTLPAFTLWPGQRVTVWAGAGINGWRDLYAGSATRWDLSHLSVEKPYEQTAYVSICDIFPSP